MFSGSAFESVNLSVLKIIRLSGSGFESANLSVISEIHSSHVQWLSGWFGPVLFSESLFESANLSVMTEIHASHVQWLRTITQNNIHNFTYKCSYSCITELLQLKQMLLHVSMTNSSKCSILSNFFRCRKQFALPSVHHNKQFCNFSVSSLCGTAWCNCGESRNFYSISYISCSHTFRTVRRC